MKGLGKEGEDLAERLLKKKGYSILERNFRTSFGEIDLIARDGETIVFVEVKTKREDLFAMPFESVTRKKREKIRKVALAYLRRLGKEMPARFDVLSLVVRGGECEVEHIRDAFEV